MPRAKPAPKPSPAGVRIDIARLYDEVGHDPAPRILVDRLWPRGLAKADAPFATWAKEVAPSTELRRWYAHDAVLLTATKELDLSHAAVPRTC